MIKTYLLILVYICYLPSTSRSQELQWRELDGFRGDQIKFAKNDTFLFAISPEVGVYRTSDKGVTMEKVNSGLPNGMPKNERYWIRAITVQDGFVIVGTDSGRIYRSTNNGDSWIESSNQLVGKSIHAFGRVGDVLFAGTERGAGIYKSTDYGETWTESYNNPENNVINSFATIGNTIVAGGRYLIRSTDFGKTWKNSFSEYGLGVWQLTANATTFFAATHNTGMIRGDNDGTIWSDINTGFNTSFGTSIESVFATDARIFAGTFSGVYQSIDKGESWKNISKNLTGGFTDFAIIGSTIFVGATSGIYRAELPVSVNESIIVSDFSISPNPASNYINVKCSGSGTLSVRDVFGSSRVKDLQISNSEITISTTDFTDGVYFVEYVGKNSIRKVEKILILK